MAGTEKKKEEIFKNEFCWYYSKQNKPKNIWAVTPFSRFQALNNLFFQEFKKLHTKSLDFHRFKITRLIIKCRIWINFIFSLEEPMNQSTNRPLFKLCSCVLTRFSHLFHAFHVLYNSWSAQGANEKKKKKLLKRSLMWNLVPAGFKFISCKIRCQDSRRNL